MAILTRNVEPGYALPQVARLYRIDHFKRGTDKTIHNDDEAAKREGLPAPVAVGPQIAALLFRQLRACFEQGWIEGGRCSINFRRPVYLPELCVAKGIVTRREAEGDAVRVHCDVWIENAKGDKVIAGTASGLVFA